MIVILLGPPGVGKGTQAARLSDGAGLRHLSTGDLLRAHRREGTELGDRAQEYMDAGELVPDDLIMDMVREELEESSGEGVVFDGFPRTAEQAEGLDELLEELGRSVDRVVVLEADDETLVKRLAGRRSCSRCGAVYNVHFNPPAAADICDRCGQEGLTRRKDDAPGTVRNRLEVYRRRTEPLIRRYEAGSVRVVRVDGEQEVDAVQRDLREALGDGARAGAVGEGPA